MKAKKKPARKVVKKVVSRKPNEAKAKKKLAAARATGRNLVKKVLKKIRAQRSAGGQVIDRAKDLLSGSNTPSPKPSMPVLMGVDERTFEAEVKRIIDSKQFAGRYIVEAPTGTREVQNEICEVDRPGSTVYKCSACGTECGSSAGPYLRVGYTNSRHTAVRERGCKGCQTACLMAAAELGSMPMPSDLMKALKLLAVRGTNPVWEKQIEAMNNRYVGNAVDVRVFKGDFKIPDEIKRLVSGTEALIEHLPEPEDDESAPDGYFDED